MLCRGASLSLERGSCDGLQPLVSVSSKVAGSNFREWLAADAMTKKCIEDNSFDMMAALPNTHGVEITLNQLPQCYPLEYLRVREVNRDGRRLTPFAAPTFRHL